MKLLFLDIDGVLNDHTRTPSGFATLQPDKVALLNQILKQCPDVQIVISSAWRYYVLNGMMTLDGFIYMLQTYGICCYKRVHGITDKDGQELGEYIHGESDPNEWATSGIRWRADLCQAYADAQECANYVILDDLALDHPNLVQTNGSRGLTIQEATEVIRRFNETKDDDA